MTVTHDIDVLPPGSERMDAYLARRRPERTEAEWYVICQSGDIEIRDYFDPAVGTYTKERWFLQWWDGEQWVRLLDLEPGTRPRMHNTFCYIVQEQASPSSP